MAIYIPIKKEQEDDVSVVYAYGIEKASPAPTGLNSTQRRLDVSYEWGSFRLNKQSGEYESIRVPSGDHEKERLKRAVIKAWQHWKDESVFPDETCWAS